MTKGNAVTQSFMTIPALLAAFPDKSSPTYAARTALIGKQWPYCWAVGNVVFRPMSTLGFLGYSLTSFRAYSSSSTEQDWRLLAIAASLHLTTILHSAINMQPLNDQLAALDGHSEEAKLKSSGKSADAEALLNKWAKWNLVRFATPLFAGILALSQAL